MFILDNLILGFIKSLCTNTYTQFATLTGLFIISEIVFPSKKVKK